MGWFITIVAVFIIGCGYLFFADLYKEIGKMDD